MWIKILASIANTCVKMIKVSTYCKYKHKNTKNVCWFIIRTNVEILSQQGSIYKYFILKSPKCPTVIVLLKYISVSPAKEHMSQRHSLHKVLIFPLHTFYYKVVVKNFVVHFQHIWLSFTSQNTHNYIIIVNSPVALWWYFPSIIITGGNFLV